MARCLGLSMCTKSTKVRLFRYVTFLPERFGNLIWNGGRRTSFIWKSIRNSFREMSLTFFCMRGTNLLRIVYVRILKPGFLRPVFICWCMMRKVCVLIFNGGSVFFCSTRLVILLIISGMVGYGKSGWRNVIPGVVLVGFRGLKIISIWLIRIKKVILSIRKRWIVDRLLSSSYLICCVIRDIWMSGNRR